MHNQILSQKIVYIGIDVHKSTYSFSALSGAETKAQHFRKTKSSSEEVFKFIEYLRTVYGNDALFICAYEAGPCGFHLKKEINEAGGCCSIIPLSYVTPFRANSRIKTDKRDAEAIAQCLKSGNFYEVYTPGKEDEETKDLLRTRDQLSEEIKQVKQQILAFLLEKGVEYAPGTNKRNWTDQHRKWLKSLKFDGLSQYALDIRIGVLEELEQFMKMTEIQIEETAQSKRYRKHVQMLRCFCGIETLTALCFIVEIGDFGRFLEPGQLASFLGLVPGEHSSGGKHNKTGITKAGNKRLRTKAILVAQHLARTDPKRKSKALLMKQEGNTPEMINYADRANRRCAEKFRRMVFNGKPRNVAICAVAREIVNFIWGAMVGKIA